MTVILERSRKRIINQYLVLLSMSVLARLPPQYSGGCERVRIWKLTVPPTVKSRNLQICQREEKLTEEMVFMQRGETFH